MLFFVFLSCTKEDDNVTTDNADSTEITDNADDMTNINQAPEFVTDYNANPIPNVLDNIDDTVVIAIIEAIDKDGDDLVFSLENNSKELFEITANGDLSLASGKSLDYNTTTSHVIKVEVSDGFLSSFVDLVIGVDYYNQAPVIDVQSFTVSRTATHENIIGVVHATDSDGDTLTYTVDYRTTGYIHGLGYYLQYEFDDPNEGGFSLKTNWTFSSFTQDQFSVTVSDGVASSSAIITVNITD